MESATYTHGHHPSVLRAHTWRTARNSVAFVLPHVQPAMRILDLGCGPGSITVDLAAYVPSGHITGVDAVGSVLEQARALAQSRGVRNITFTTGDANALPFADGAFDLVLVHQMLQHVADPVAILREMKRVTQRGGLVAVREADFGGFIFHPRSAPLDRWMELYAAVARRNGGEPHAGRRLHVWARQAGLTDVACSSSTWCYATRDEIQWWSGLWAERTVASSLAQTAEAHGLASADELAELSAGWEAWGEEEEAWFSCLHGEIICRV
ncbi:hypothetical protein ASPZODRAFT_96289 [Penicilliopsis zonata CBS 506.65]|uniref:Methyltransferase domain-containing protein n=1 Tax=Penicilliopsis zonata CBS 506.65 TaxID=1073090 RepID=A0A1L9SJD2_9EURO|nr:hypothetical protein ASPZODRAFT_96289 [Penicilliopsis zonata CBS 506.65]OJJ47339.1 hypothetical protein ASPZODRAFT_96289 [Penicilliopsis zonata CBS 506.65]